MLFSIWPNWLFLFSWNTILLYLQPFDSALLTNFFLGISYVPNVPRSLQFLKLVLLPFPSLLPPLFICFFLFSFFFRQFHSQDRRGHFCYLRPLIIPSPFPIHQVVLSVVSKYPSCLSSILYLHEQPHHCFFKSLNESAPMPSDPTPTQKPCCPQSGINRADNDSLHLRTHKPGVLYCSLRFQMAHPFSVSLILGSIQWVCVPAPEILPLLCLNLEYFFSPSTC